MKLEVLGPLRVVDDEGRHVPVPAPRLRVLLAALALHANAPVPTEALAELVWDGAPPGAASVTLRSYVHRLRTELGPALARRIVSHPPGYTCLAEEQEVDALWFEALCRETDAAVRERRWAQASQTAELAASLWRGTPLLDVPCQTLHDEFAPRLEQLRTQMLENQVEAALALGRHEHWVQPLRELVTAHPLRERFHAQLMQALARCGRQAEALAAYQDARKLLVEELGIEPGPELRQLHKRILAGEGNPAAPRASAEQAPEIAPVAAAVPRQLPVATRHFTGRRDELDLITGLHRSSRPTDVPGGTVVISAIDGMAGIGKTTLAIHAAHRLAEQFPDGQLFLDLHGYTEGQRPRTPEQALGWLLRALGESPERIPTDAEQAAALYRQRLADTRTLIVLDNAATEAQVRPLLPGTDSCLVLVTSRRRLKGLDDAHALSLEVLPTTEAVALLRAVAGLDRVPSEDPLPTEIAELCGHLPLALRIAAALLRHRPAWGLEHLAGLLREQHRRVQALSDGERDLGGVLDLSYRSLDAPHRTLWRRLGLIPGPDLDAYAVAALLDRDAADATRLLEDLVDHNLLVCHAPGRYRLHDLLRAHAHTLAAADPASEREEALDRLLHYYAHTARIASIPITRCPPRTPTDPAHVHAPDLPDPETARAWLRTERENLEHARAYAHTHDLHEHTLALTAGLAEILRTDGPYSSALALHRAAADTAEHHGHPAAHADALANLGIMQRLGGDLDGAVDTFTQALKIRRTTDDQRGEADVLAELGRARGYAGDLTRAVDTFTQALEIYRRTGERRGEADMLAELGIMRRVSGELAGADDAFGQALEIYRATDDRHGEADALTELGRVRALAGDLAGARDAFGRALDYYRATGHHHGEAYALTNLGTVLRRTGNLVDAENALVGALKIYRAVGYGQGEAEALTNLGTVLREAGKLAEADDAQARALEIYREIGSRHDEAWALNHHAATIAARGDLPRALALYRRALRMNIELDKPDGQALALEGLGECHLTIHETETGAAGLHEALTIYQRLGMASDAERVRDRLAGLTAI